MFSVIEAYLSTGTYQLAASFAVTEEYNDWEQFFAEVKRKLDDKNESANNRDNVTSNPGKSKKIKKYQEYLISLFNAHSTLNSFKQQNIPLLDLVRKYARMNYPAFLKINPLKFTKIIIIAYRRFQLKTNCKYHQIKDTQ